MQTMEHASPKARREQLSAVSDGRPAMAQVFQIP